MKASHREIAIGSEPAAARIELHDRVLGTSAPLGATVTPEGVNVSVFSKRATSIELLLFEHVDDAKPATVIRLDPTANRTHHFWHVFVPGIYAGQIYGLRVHGAFDPSVRAGRGCTSQLQPQRSA